MGRVLPILFNAEMVRAILDDRKTVTRRVIKVPPYYPYFYKMHDNSDGALTGTKNRLFAGFYSEDQIFYVDGEKHIDAVYYQAPYQVGDVLYVRETVWQQFGTTLDTMTGETCFYDIDNFKYCATDTEPISDGHHHWRKRPSIHMPKEAARIWLKVTNVRVERLQEMTASESAKEGIQLPREYDTKERTYILGFADLWDSTLKKSDLDRYGWDADPWVWVIEFERCEKPEPCTLTGIKPAEKRGEDIK